MLVKVCGLRDAANIRAVEALGADWAGFVFYPRSPRYVSAPPAYLPRRCRRVGVFVNAQPDDVADHVRRYGLGAVQLHGDEPPRYCHRLRRLLPPGCLLLKAVGIGSAADVDRATAYGPDACDYLLFDTACAGRGGCGRTFDWDLLARYPDRGFPPFLLSGGIGPDALPALARFAHPRWAGVDLNSRFEAAPGLKRTDLLASFIEKFRKLTSNTLTSPNP